MNTSETLERINKIKAWSLAGDKITEDQEIILNLCLAIHKLEEEKLSLKMRLKHFDKNFEPEPMSRAEELLLQMSLGLEVSRWEVSRNRKAINLILNEGRFPQLKNQVRDHLDSADLSR